MDVARPQFDSLFKEIVDRTNHRRTAGKVAQAFDIVVAQLPETVRGGEAFGTVIAEPFVEGDGQLVKSRNLDLEIGAEHDLSGALSGEIGRIRNDQDGAAIDKFIREDKRFAQETLREGVHQRRGVQHLLQRHTLTLVVARHLIGEFASRQVSDLPKPLVRSQTARGLV